jgi:hypothetical protein
MVAINNFVLVPSLRSLGPVVSGMSLSSISSVITTSSPGSNHMSGSGLHHSHHHHHQNIQYPPLTPLSQLNNHLYNSSLNVATTNALDNINQSTFQSNFPSTLNHLIKTENGSHTNLSHALSNEMEKSALDMKHRQLLANIESR